jgi:hypothetical protein
MRPICPWLKLGILVEKMPHYLLLNNIFFRDDTSVNKPILIQFVFLVWEVERLRFVPRREGGSFTRLSATLKTETAGNVDCVCVCVLLDSASLKILHGSDEYFRQVDIGSKEMFRIITLTQVLFVDKD